MPAIKRRITAAVAANTIANGNWPQTWNWAQTTAAQTGMAFGETSAASGGAGNTGLATAGLMEKDEATDGRHPGGRRGRGLAVAQ